MHTAYIASEGWENFWQGTEPLGYAQEEHLANAIFFNFVLNVPEDGMTTAQLRGTPWPFDLIMKCVAVQPIKEQLRMYKPRSDLLILKSTLPRLLVEVNSSETEEWPPPDLIRVLLKGAAIVRFANTFLDAFKKKDFVFVAIFMRDSVRATRYTLFQKQNGQAVYYTEKFFWLNDSVDRVRFARQLYNLLHVPVGDKEAKETRAKIGQLKDKILKHNMEFPMKSDCFTPMTLKGPRGN
ncbi:hypothetical protein BJV78DRAFT_1381972, partial [Lactifluus subvellereus]